jgi:DNA-binding transcriptional MerR regulator
MKVTELARRSGVPVRTLRFYQTEGLLQAPARVGREARYDDAHLERLRRIAELRERGLQLTAIREVFAHGGGENGSLHAWLGLGETLARPWTEDRPALWTQSQLDERLAGRPVPHELLEHFGLAERRTDTNPVTWLVPSPALLELALDLTDLGVPPDVAVGARALLQKRLGRLADDLVAHMTERVSLDRLASGGPEAVAALVDALRPIGQRAVGVVFAHEMERALRSIAELGSEPVT